MSSPDQEETGQRIARDVLTELLRREHRPSTPELRPLAHRAGVI